MNKETVNKKKLGESGSANEIQQQHAPVDSATSKIEKTASSALENYQLSRQLSNSSSKDDVIILSGDTNEEASVSKKAHVASDLAASTTTTTTNPTSQAISSGVREPISLSQSSHQISDKNHQMKDLSKVNNCFYFI